MKGIFLGSDIRAGITELLNSSPGSLRPIEQVDHEKDKYSNVFYGLLQVTANSLNTLFPTQLSKKQCRELSRLLEGLSKFFDGTSDIDPVVISKKLFQPDSTFLDYAKNYPLISPDGYKPVFVSMQNNKEDECKTLRLGIIDSRKLNSGLEISFVVSKNCTLLKEVSIALLGMFEFLPDNTKEHQPSDRLDEDKIGAGVEPIIFILGEEITAHYIHRGELNEFKEIKNRSLSGLLKILHIKLQNSNKFFSGLTQFLFTQK